MRAVRDSVRSRIPSKGWVSRAYEWFLELPVTIVLAVLWLAGVVLMGLFVWHSTWTGSCCALVQGLELFVSSRELGSP